MPELQGKQEVVVLLSALNASSVNIPERRLLLTREAPIVRIGRSSKRKSSLEASPTNAYFDCPVMSRHHAELKMDHDRREVVLRDAGSLHGTQLNRLPLRNNEHQIVTSGDTVTFGMPIDRGSESFSPQKVSAEIHWKPASQQDQPVVFRVPDDSDIEEISGDEDNGILHARHVLQENNFRPASGSSHAPLDLTVDHDSSQSDIPGDEDKENSPHVSSCDMFLEPSKETEPLNSKEITEEQWEEKIINTDIPGAYEDDGIHDSIGYSPLDESMVSNDSEDDGLSARSSSVDSDGLLDERDDIDENSLFSVEEDNYETQINEGKEEDFEEHDDFMEDFGDASLPFAGHDEFPGALAVPSQETGDGSQDGNKEAPKRTKKLAGCASAFLRDLIEGATPQQQVDPLATVHTATANVPQMTPTAQEISAHGIQDEFQKLSPYQTIREHKAGYFHAREENRRVLGLPPGYNSGSVSKALDSEKTSGRADTQADVQDEAQDVARNETQDQEILPLFNKPSLGVDVDLSNDLVKSGAKFLNTPLTNDVVTAATVRAPSPFLNETSAYQFEMSKKATEAEVDSEKSANMSIKSIVEETRPDKVAPNKRKADEISQSSPEEEEEVVVQTNGEGAPVKTCESNKTRKQEPVNSLRSAPLPLQHAMSTSSNEPRPPKRLRRAAEVFGYAAIGGIAVMSALIATAPAL